MVALWALLGVGSLRAQDGGGDTGNAGDTSGVFEAPQDLAICQIAYGAIPRVRLSWSNPESYQQMAVSVDGTEVPAFVDGTHGTAEVEVATGMHEFEVQGLVGESSSMEALLSFDVLAASPVQSPVQGLECELVPERGGSLIVRWAEEADNWVGGEVRVGGRIGNVEFARNGREVEIALDGEALEVVEVAFRNQDCYFSEPTVLVCEIMAPTFRRGDCDRNGEINITDAIFQINHLFKGGPRWRCDDACDANDDGFHDVADPTSTLNYLFLGLGPPAAPGPLTCGVDPTPDFLGGICTDACR